MKSVRMLAAGAAILGSLGLLTAPVRACDDRFLKKCEAEAEAAFLAETQATTTVPRRKAVRVRAAAPVAVRRTPVRHVAVPAAPRPNEAFTLASDEDRAAPAPQVAALPESPLTRRFRGFIDPQPMTVNSFEALRKPRLEPEHLAPAPAMPPGDETAVAPDDELVMVDASLTTSKPAAEPASAPAAAPQPVFAEASTAPANDGPGGFPLGKLALTLCAALGVASALRFIVRA